MKNVETKFWMVWCPASNVRHGEFVPTCADEDTANNEADRLAKKYPGSRIYVMEAKRAKQANEVHTVELEDPMPF